MRADAGRPVCLALDSVTALRAPELIAQYGAPDVIAIDMPLATGPIIARRVADNAICSAFAAAQAAVHDPALMQSGLADCIRADFAAAGYRLAVPGHTGIPALIETYPHPIMMQLCHSRRRVPYKAGKTRIYWPELDMAARRHRLRAVWERIHAALVERMTVRLPDLDQVFAHSFAAMKPFEDRLDALACALGGVAFARGEAVPYGDDFAAIWLPRGAESYREWAA